MKEWFNDSIHRCGKCGTIFKVYVLEDDTGISFCPNCGCCLSEDDLTEEEIEGLED